MKCLQTNQGTRRVRTGNEKALGLAKKLSTADWRKGHKRSLEQMHNGRLVLAKKQNECSTIPDNTKSALFSFFSGLSTLSIQIRFDCAKADSVSTHSWASATTSDASALKKITYPGTNNFTELVYNGTGQLVKLWRQHREVSGAASS